jgi:hypothetical protein
MKSAAKRKTTPKIACLMWFTAGLIFSSFHPEIIIKNPPQITKITERSPAKSIISAIP